MSGVDHDPKRLRIESIRVGRAPGIEGAFSVADLGPGVTVIHGPNGSGKSTTARAIHALLWPEPPDDGCLIDATLTYAGYRWSIRRDGTAVSCRRNGLDHTPLTFAHLTPDTRDRYHLALHDLLKADDEAFAASVTREASGGFDLEAAGSAVKFTASPPAPAQLARSLREARDAYQRAVQHQQELEQQESDLAVLNAESARARQAGITILTLNAIGEALTARAELEEAIVACHHFDTGMAHVQPGHAKTLAGWRNDEPALLQRLSACEAAIAREDRRLAALGLPSERETARVLRILQAQSTELRAAEEARRNAEIAHASARRQLGALQAEIAPHLPESLRTGEAIRLLRAYAEALDRQEDAARIAGAESQLDAWIPRPAHVPDPERFQEAWRLLAAWLQTPPEVASPALGATRLLALAAAALAIAEGGLLGLVWNPLGFALAVAGLAIGLIALFAGRTAIPVNERRRFEEEYARLDLPEPSAWTEESVAELLRQTLRATVQEQTAAEAATRWRSLTPELERRHQAMAAAREQADALATRLGVDVRLDRPALAAMTGALDGWLKASRDVDQLGRNHSLLLEAEQAGLDAFNGSAAGIGSEPAANGNEAAAILGHLQDLLDELKQASRAIDTAAAERDTRILPALDRIAQEREALIERYGGERSLDEIEGLAGQHEGYQLALQLVRARRDRVASRLNQLPEGVVLTDWTLERVQIEIAGERAVQDQSTDVNQRIGAIEQSIRTAKARDDVAAALAEVDRARDALRERRDDHLLKTVGRLLLDEVRRETREANLPAVAHRARVLFTELTHGRYRLNFNPGPPASFTATDTTTGAEQALDQLSSGTRVQLLIAVRTAFVDQNEQEAALPMIFDETLANADAARAEAMIATAFRLAERGRQVFYFTAQQDEVEKWRHLAKEHGTEIQVIDLAAIRRLEALSSPAFVDLPPIERPHFPPPNGHSRLEYRHVIGAPPLNLWSIDGGDIHLWHLIDDPEQLHRLVAGQHLAQWGQIRQLTVDGEAPALGLDRDSLQQMTARADACLALIEAARVGRGRPVTSQALHASTGMTDRFTGDCLRLLEECEGNARRFIECLENKAIAGFYSKHIERFRDYFESNGHIVAETALTAEEVRVRVLQRMSEAIEAGLIDFETIDRLMDEAFQSTGPAPAPASSSAVVLSGSD